MTSPVAAASYHKCPKTDCPRDVRYEQYACPRHWFQLSPPTRRRILRTWSQGDLVAHAQAMHDAATELNGSD